MVTCNNDSFTSMSIFFLASLSVKLAASPAKRFSKAVPRRCQPNSCSLSFPYCPQISMAMSSFALYMYPRSRMWASCKKQTNKQKQYENKKLNKIFEYSFRQTMCWVFSRIISHLIFIKFCVVHFLYFINEDLKQLTIYHKSSTLIISLDLLEGRLLSWWAWLL